MNEENLTVPEGADTLSFALGQWMGRREAFGLIAGRCSAADIEIVRRIKEEKLYARLNCTWSEFCSRHLHVARRTVDEEIQHLHKFGPAFFTIRQLTHMRIKDYQAIAPHITEQGVHLDGHVAPLLPEHSEALTAAVQELVRRSASPRGTAAAKSTPSSTPPFTPMEALTQQCQSIRQALLLFERPLTELEKVALGVEIVQIQRAAEVLIMG